jgi:hypothetical protein
MPVNRFHIGREPPREPEIFHGYHILSRISGVVVSVLAIGPRVCGFESGQGDGFLRAIKIRSTSSFRIGSKAGCPMS